jgi:hypothetical protein
MYVETNEYIDESVGRCNREDKCGYHCKPKDYFEKNRNLKIYPNLNTPKIHSGIKPSTNKNEEYSILCEEKVFDSQIPDKENNFFEYLKIKFSFDEAMRLREMYRFGSSEKWKGSTIFYQIDIHERYRTGKIMLYDKISGKRIKHPYNHISWVHNELEGFKLKQCLFGEHLLKNNNLPVAIVESEKTAIICSHFLKNFVWLATGGKSNLNPEMLKGLKDRDVTLFPDLGAFKEWGNKMKNELGFIKSIKLDNTLERHATEALRKKGGDIADFFIENLTNQIL